MAICIDYADAYAAAIRAAIPFHDMLHQLAHHGATHVSLPELTLNRLLASGRLAPQAPPNPRVSLPRIGHWNFVHGPAELIALLRDELTVRLPYTEAEIAAGSTLVFAGDLQTVGEIGLGFEPAAAEQIAAHGLGVVPRPVSYAWPERHLIDRTLVQAATYGILIAFDGDMILGHEMHLDETLAAMEREDLTFAYFAESRHQKGDWFVAKRRAPAQRVVLAYRFTPEEMIPLDFHAAAHVWAHLARERGIRLCYVNFFRVLHATEPLEGLHYIEHIKEALEHDGFVVTPNIEPPAPAPTPTKSDLAVTGLASAGVVASAASAILDLPEAGAFSLAAAAGAAALPYLERARGRLEEQYPPSYAPKILALAATLAPLTMVNTKRGVDAWLAGLISQAGAAASLAVLISGQDYHLRIEEYRGFNLDWLLPLLGAAASIPNRGLRVGAMAALSGLWALAHRYRVDPLARVDPAHAEGHTHHLSAAARLVGDAKIALGPQPARKWAGLGPFGSAMSLALASRGHRDWAAAAALLGAAGNVLGLVGFRRPERAIALTAREAARSFSAGTALGLACLLFFRSANERR